MRGSTVFTSITQPCLQQVPHRHTHGTKYMLVLSCALCRLADLLVAGVVMNQALQPHESHIPFVLQFMMDHHLFGMNHIHLSAVKFRIAGSGECERAVLGLSISRRAKAGP